MNFNHLWKVKIKKKPLVADSWEGKSEGKLPGNCSSHEEEHEAVKQQYLRATVVLLGNLLYLLDEKFTFSWDLSIRIRYYYIQ